MTDSWVKFSSWEPTGRASSVPSTSNFHTFHVQGPRVTSDSSTGRSTGRYGRRSRTSVKLWVFLTHSSPIDISTLLYTLLQSRLKEAANTFVVNWYFLMEPSRKSHAIELTSYRWRNARWRHWKLHTWYDNHIDLGWLCGVVLWWFLRESEVKQRWPRLVHGWVTVHDRSRFVAQWGVLMQLKNRYLMTPGVRHSGIVNWLIYLFTLLIFEFKSPNIWYSSMPHW